MDPIFWSVVFVVLMLCMVAIELLTPTMGGFVLVAAIFSGVSIYTGFLHSSAAGFVMIAVNVTLFPLAIFLGSQFLRKSPIIHQTQNTTGIQNSPESSPLNQLKGEIGKTLTPLRPAGAALINERKVDVVSEGKFIEAGTVVKVLRVTGGTVIVEAVE